MEEEKFVLNPFVENVISALSNESRLLILHKLKEKSEKISSLAKALGLNIQDTHRNVNRMIEAKLLEKDLEGYLSLTPLGKMVTILFPSFEFVIKHIEYFHDHSLDELSEKFLQRMGALYNCELVKGVVLVLERWKELINQAEDYLKVVTTQTPLESVELAFQKANKGLNIKLVLGENTIFPERYKELLRQYNIEKLSVNGIFETKIIKRVNCYLVFSEKEASLSLSRSNGEVDINQTFFGKDPLFLEWCHDLFNEIWESGKPSNPYLGQKF